MCIFCTMHSQLKKKNTKYDYSANWDNWQLYMMHSSDGNQPVDKTSSHEPQTQTEEWTWPFVLFPKLSSGLTAQKPMFFLHWLELKKENVKLYILNWEKIDNYIYSRKVSRNHKRL